MIKIGFIDYYIDEWHANNYPRMIRESEYGDKMEVHLAWEESTIEGKVPLDEWCKTQNVRAAKSQEEVVEECDALVILSPDNPEKHEELSRLALGSGKPVYIDKPFAPDLACAKRIFELAEKNNTPLMSCSALRYGSGLQNIMREQAEQLPASHANTIGSGNLSVYGIHQVEMIVMVMGTGAKRVMQIGKDPNTQMVIEYADGRRASIHHMHGHPFKLSLMDKDGAFVELDDKGDYFAGLMNALGGFFETGVSKVPKEETLEIVSILEGGAKALETPDTWLEI